MDGTSSSLRMGKVSYAYKTVVSLNWKNHLVDLDVENLYTDLRDIIYQGTKILISTTVRASDLHQFWD